MVAFEPLMIGNEVAWWEGVEVSLDVVRLADMAVHDLKEIFKTQFVPNITREMMRDKFRKLRQEGMGVHSYANVL